jgi:hypothetical protein
MAVDLAERLERPVAIPEKARRILGSRVLGVGSWVLRFVTDR